MPTSSSNLWKTQIGSFELTAIHIDDNGEIMIRQEDFILKPANKASVVIRTQRFLGREYQYVYKLSLVKNSTRDRSL